METPTDCKWSPTWIFMVQYPLSPSNPKHSMILQIRSCPSIFVQIPLMLRRCFQTLPPGCCDITFVIITTKIYSSRWDSFKRNTNWTSVRALLKYCSLFPIFLQLSVRLLITPEWAILAENSFHYQDEIQFPTGGHQILCQSLKNFFDKRSCMVCFTIPCRVLPKLVQSQPMVYTHLSATQEQCNLQFLLHGDANEEFQDAKSSLVTQTQMSLNL